MKKAMTLIETTLYLALFGIAFLMIVQFGLSLSEYQRLSLNRSNIQKTIVILNQEFLNSVDLAETIDPDSDFDINNGVLILNTESGDITYSVETGRLVKENNATEINLTASEHIITEFMFTEIFSDDDIIVGIKIDITLAYGKNLNITESLSTIYAL